MEKFLEKEDVKTIKICSKCKQEKSINEFNKDSSNKDGLNYWCTDCHKEYYQKHKQKIKKHQKEYDQEHKPEKNKYNQEHKPERKEYDKKYNQEHKPEKNKYQKEKYQNDELYRLYCKISRSLRHHINKNNKHIFDILNYTVEDLKIRLDDTLPNGKSNNII